MPRLLGLDGALLDPATDERRLMTDEVKQLHDIVNSSESDEQAKVLSPSQPSPFQPNPGPAPLSPHG